MEAVWPCQLITARQDERVRAAIDALDGQACQPMPHRVSPTTTVLSRTHTIALRC